MNETLLNALHLLVNPYNLGKEEWTDLMKLRKHAQNDVINNSHFLPEPKVIGTVSQRHCWMSRILLLFHFIYTVFLQTWVSSCAN